MDDIEQFLFECQCESKNVEVINAPDTGCLDDRSMIDYWCKETGLNIELARFQCPATGEFCTKEKLDGAHVLVVNHEDWGYFITPVLSSFNRSRNDTHFWVKPEHLIKAPK